MQRTSLFIAATLLCAQLVCAQTTTSLSGTVMVEGQPVAGVTVTVSSPALQGTRSTTTGETGAYRFAALPPGEYDLEFVQPDTAKRTAHVTLQLSQPAR